MPDPTRNDWDLAAQAMAAENERLAAENTRLRCQLDQMATQEWTRRVRVMEDNCDEADDRLRRAKSVTVFWLLVAAIFAAASTAQAVYIFWR